MNKIPTYTICGFLDSGKTTFINKSISDMNNNIGVLLFENGDTTINPKYSSLVIPIRKAKNFDENLCAEIYEFIHSNDFDELWIELNGFMEIELLDKILSYEFSNKNILSLLHFEDTIYIAKPDIFKPLINDYASVNVNQILSSNTAYIVSTSKKEIKSTKNKLKNINSNLNIHTQKISPKDMLKKTSLSSIHKLILVTIAVGLFYLFSRMFIPNNILPMNNITIIFLGILLQAFPFLLLGVMISSAIQLFVSTDFIDKHFPKDTLSGVLFATIIGFFFPVCDCATIPVFRSLIRKGIPISAAISFMVATPILNPIVILSTYTAFNGNFRVVFLRCALGFLVALIIGLIFSVLGKNNIIKGNTNTLLCNIYYTKDDSNFMRYIKQVQGEFFDVSKYLVIGALLSSVIQTVLTKFNWLNSGYGHILSIIIMILIAFILSLCSSSDAIIARSFGTHFPFTSIMAFLIFGPIIDIKNLIMLSSSFKRSFIIKFTAITFIVCFVLMSLLSLM